MTTREAYDILGVAPGATAAEIKAAYRRRVNETHPDKGGDPAEFIRVRAAYEILMTYLHEAVGEEEAPLPPELRMIIDEIVRLFRAELAFAEEETKRWLDHFHDHMRAYVAAAPRHRLRKFGAYFADAWNRYIAQLFSEFNGRCDAILAKYEDWFHTRTAVLREEAYTRQRHNFWRSRRFWILVGGGIVLGALVGADRAAAGDAWTLVTSMLGLGGLGLFVFLLSARSRRPRSEERIEPLDIVPFRLDTRAGFVGSEALREGRSETIGASATGFILGDILTTGLAGPLLGGLIGWTIGEIGDRMMRPTHVVRDVLLLELAEFMRTAQPELTRYILETQQDLLKDLRAKIIANYQNKMRASVRLLTRGS